MEHENSPRIAPREGSSPTVLELACTDRYGGGAVVPWDLRAELMARGHRVPMIVGFKKSGDPGVRSIYDTPLNRWLSGLVGRNVRAAVHRRLSPWIADDIRWLPGRRILGWREVREADVIHAHVLHSHFFNLTALPALARRRPVVWTLHDMWAFTGQPTFTFDCEHWQHGGCDCRPPVGVVPHRWNNTRRLWRRKRRIYEGTPLTLVVPSRWLGEKVERSMLRDKPLHLIYNGVDTGLFRPRDRAALRARLGLPPDRRIVLFASKGGKQAELKGLSHALRLVEEWGGGDGVAFVFVGGGPEVPGVRSLGYVRDRREMAELYAACDLYLHPSLADNCPLSVLEAMACGLPVVTFATGGIPELVGHREHGYVAAYGDGDDLAAGFGELLALPAERWTEMSHRVREHVERRFTTGRMTDEYQALFERVLEARA